MNIDMTKEVNTKKIVIISGILVLITGIIIGAIFLVTTVNTPTYQNSASKSKAEQYKNEAIDALDSNKTDKAKELFKKAKEQYQKIGDSVGTTDMEAQIYIIEHSNE